MVAESDVEEHENEKDDYKGDCLTVGISFVCSFAESIRVVQCLVIIAVDMAVEITTG